MAASQGSPLVSAKDYDVKRVLGRGSFGVAKLVTRKRDGTKFVIKEIVLAESETVNLKRELETLSQAISSHVVRLFGYFREDEVLHLVMEYCETDLQKEIDAVSQKGHEFSEEKIYNLFKQIAFALKYLHDDKKIIHRDIKPANIMIAEKGRQIKLGDFGFAKAVEDRPGAALTHTAFRGTVAYFSPELCRGEKYDFKVDVWAFGVVAYQLATLELPFSLDGTLSDYMKAISEGTPKPIKKSRSLALRNIISKMLTKDQKNRPSISDVLNDDYIISGVGNADDDEDESGGALVSSSSSEPSDAPTDVGKNLIGCRVVRGPNWKWDDQDGGEGGVGTIVRFQDGGKQAIVAWDGGVQANYRCSKTAGGYDLRILDNAPAGVVFKTVRCDGCQKTPLKGMRYTCIPCSKANKDTFDLCMICYHTSVHDLDHKFLRSFNEDGPKVVLEERLPLYKKQAKGIFPGAVVIRGRDWEYGDQDGGKGKSGIVTKFDENDGKRSAVEVKWLTTKQTNNYRVGMGGKVELRSAKDEDWIKYYAPHLPVVDPADEKAGSDAPDSGVEASADENEQALLQFLAALILAKAQNS